MKILIRHATIVTVNESNEVILDGSIAIVNDRIHNIAQTDKADIDFIPDYVIDAEGGIVMPGLINAHTHLAMVLLRNYADDLPLWEWLMHHIKPLEDHLTPDDIEWGSRLGIAELIKGGTTCFLDMYFQMGRTAEVVAETGIRAAISGALFDRTVEGDDAALGERMLREAVDFHHRWDGKGRVHTMLAPHSPYLCSPGYLRTIGAEARNLRCGIHTHLSETRDEVDRSLETYGKSPIAHVADLGLFESPTVAAHCIHLEPGDMHHLRPVHVVHNPSSNLKLGSGIAPIPQFCEQGINVALGTDGAASNNNLNMFEELHLASLIAKGSTHRADALAAPMALALATRNGAKALGLAHQIGSLERGKKADIILLSPHEPHLVPRNNPIATLCYSAQASDVDTVIIDGTIVMEKRQFTLMDEAAIIAGAECQCRSLIDRAT